MIIHSITIYENDKDGFNGMNKLFNAFADVMIYNHIEHGKKFNLDLIEKWNIILTKFKKEKDTEQKTRLHILLKKIIDSNYKYLVELLDSLRNVQPILETEANVSRIKVKGCIGTVVEA